LSIPVNIINYFYSVELLEQFLFKYTAFVRACRPSLLQRLLSMPCGFNISMQNKLNDERQFITINQ